MRQFPVAVAAIGLLVAACDSNGGGTGSTPETKIPTTTSKQALAPAALPDLLLGPDDIDSALGVTGWRTDKASDSLQEDPTVGLGPKGYRFPEECLYIIGPGLAPVYSNSGSSAVRAQRVAAPSAGSNGVNPNANQFVVLFPSAQQASAFFTTSTQRWPACANRQDNVPAGDAGSASAQWEVGPVSSADGVLRTTVFISLTKNGETKSQNCQRALTVRNNVVIDVSGCRENPDGMGVAIANQIADKVDKQ
ncbi:sensor domain-containing protein [Mycobacterium sp. Aquia_216]|uniref:sensor domain-containing protein n=1 Tax=Mycobacterium sp. Aquia_216 TaxID=2991729 RepID=UPI00227BCC7D|nr:sensor domain-containing protein [Mycobacterium sp. Aquia_216]WAJ43230.1 sensor domain-containing protein [Mycobacterium sp. Aquia_216]